MFLYTRHYSVHPRKFQEGRSGPARHGRHRVQERQDRYAVKSGTPSDGPPPGPGGHPGPTPTSDS